jgi:DNA invertase Pin-like site-specific DNA recombinase
MVCYGYLRVSTKQQEINNNKSEILLLADQKGLGIPIWIQETVSGRKDWRKRVLGKEFEKMKEGDILIMSEYSRIGRDFLQSIEFLSECRRRKVEIYSTLGDIPLNNDAQSNLLLAINAWKAQVEREHLSYRTKIGIKAHKEAGSILGRKPEMVLDKDPNNIRKIKELIEKDTKLKVIAKELNTTTITLRKFVKKHNLKPKKENIKVI